MSCIGVLRQLDLDAGLGLELLDRLEQRVVLGLVEALDPPDGELLLRRRRRGGQQNAGRDAARRRSFVNTFMRTPPVIGLHARRSLSSSRSQPVAAYGRPARGVNRRPRRGSRHITAPRYHGTNSLWP